MGGAAASERSRDGKGRTVEIALVVEGSIARIEALLLLVLVARAAAAAAEHLLEEAELGSDEGDEEGEQSEEAHFEGRWSG